MDSDPVSFRFFPVAGSTGHLGNVGSNRSQLNEIVCSLSSFRAYPAALPLTKNHKRQVSRLRVFR